MNDSFSVLKTSSNILFFKRRDIHIPPMSIRIYPDVMVNRYNPAAACPGSGMDSSHQLRKNSTTPAAMLVYIFGQIIFSSFTPRVPRQERARK